MKACTGCGMCEQGKRHCDTPAACEVPEDDYTWTWRDDLVAHGIVALILIVIVGIVAASLGYWSGK